MSKIKATTRQNASRKSSISNARTYEEMGEFWDTHSVADYWDRTRPVKATFRRPLKSSYLVELVFDTKIYEQLRDTALKRGVTSEEPLVSWIREKLSAQTKSSRR